MKSFSKKFVIARIGIIFLAIVLLSFNFKNKARISSFKYHNSLEIFYFDSQDLPLDTNSLFSASGNCVLCHGDPDQFPSSTANLDEFGNDVSPVNAWRATIMANAAKDPFWIAKVKHEGIENPELSEEIETLCTACHAPNGHFDAIHNGLDLYTMSDLLADPMGLDGVSCNSCHMIEDVDFGVTFSADITYNENHVEYGPYSDPFQNPMINNIGFAPEYGSHISSSEACGKCHSLITETIDEDGEITENTFVEQAIYHEWLNSNYSVEEIRCIDCHMTNLEEEIKISPMPQWLGPRTPFSIHDLVGGNVFMLSLLKENIDELDLKASEDQFEATIAETNNMLQQRALDLEIGLYSIDSDSMEIEVILENKSGHKLPSGYPSRQMMIEFLVQSTNGDTLFHSGGFNEEGRINGEENNDFEPHYDHIYNEDEVQLYEYALGNEEGELTTILTRAYSGIKDNRIPPLGFTTGHLSYDTVQIIGNAFNDPNFNISDGVEGSAKDHIYYHVPLGAINDGVIVNVKVHYIAIPRKWLDQLFENEADEIDSFELMYNQVDIESLIMKEESLFVSMNSIDEQLMHSVVLYPNPTNDELNIISEGEFISMIHLYDASGRKIRSYSLPDTKNTQIVLPHSNGKYMLKIEFSNGTSIIKSIVKI